MENWGLISLGHSLGGLSQDDSAPRGDAASWERMGMKKVLIVEGSLALAEAYEAGRAVK